MTFEELKTRIVNMKKASAWGKAVKAYALECLEYAEQCGVKPETPVEEITVGDIMNHVGGKGVKLGTWHGRAALDIIKSASEGGNFLIYNGKIAERLCSPSQFKAMHRKNGELREPRRESWLEMQTRCIIHAAWEIQATAAERRV